VKRSLFAVPEDPLGLASMGQAPQTG
jgi:hypothetical protein